MSKKSIYSLVICMLIAWCSAAQGLSNYNIDTIYLSQDSIKIHSLSLVPNSVSIIKTDGSILDSSAYTIYNTSSILVFDEKLIGNTFIVSYRTFPFELRNRVFTNDYNEYKTYRDSVGFIINSGRYRSEEISNGFIDFGKLNYEGDFSRGISFGNGQSLNLNSSFNLQLAGNLTNDIEIRAAITDNNIPIQPEGNTANLQDFDKIYVQLAYKTHFLRVGDYELKSEDSYFMKFQKNLQGVSYWGKQNISKDYTVNAKANFSISRGKYTVNELTAEEGNQGPYKLRGGDGETFIIVLSGSERVYINGELMKRGANEDYIIDYNLGEIHFTPNRLVTKDLRIKVEFEYSDNSYFRYLYHVNAGISHKLWFFDSNFYSEQDIKNQSISQDLDDDQKNVLSMIGDSINNAFYSGATQVSFTNDRVLYRKMDTIIGGNTIPIYQYSTDSNEVLYTLSFSFVGEGLGNYNPIQSVANGRVFAWVKPDAAGNSLGSYEPIILLVTPKEKQLFTSKIGIKPTLSTLITAEFALSNQDLNTFSEIDDKDDVGIGLFVNIDDMRFLNKDSTHRFVTKGSYEFKQDKFLPIERYRNIEFLRDWNVSQDLPEVNEHLGFLEAQFLNTNKGMIGYKFSFFNRDTIYNGFENVLKAGFHAKGFDLKAEAKWLNSKSVFENTNFWRPKISIGKKFAKLKGWQIGLDAYTEINRISDAITDTVIDKSFLWQDYTIFIANADSAKSKYKFSYNLRNEHLPNAKGYDKAFLRAHTFSVEGDFLDSKNHSLSWNLSYRNLQQDTLLQANDSFEHFYLGRINYRFNALKGVFSGNTLYEIGSGREQKIQYNYVESPDGQGSYAWKDINENGIQELNEFFVSSFQNENRFLRLTTNSLEYQAVNSTIFNQSLNINPKAIWFNKTGVKGFIARFSNVTSIALSKKIFSGSNVKVWNILNPIALKSNDTILVSNSNIIRSTFFFNRNDSKYSIDYSYNFNENVSLLTSGFEKRVYSTHSLRARWNITKNITLVTNYLNGFKQNNSDFYYDKRYEFMLNEFETNFSVLIKKVLRMGVNYRYAFRSNPNEITGGQFAVINELVGEIKYTKPGNFSVLTNVKYASVAYNDDRFTNEQLQIDMLQSLQNGNNYIWSVSFDKTIAKNFQLSLVYDGRKTGSSIIIHTGRAQVRAIF